MADHVERVGVNAWAFGTVVLVVAICVTAWLLDRVADRGHEIRWHERFYQPQLPRRVGRVIDVELGSAGYMGRPRGPQRSAIGHTRPETRKTAPQR